MPHHLPRGKPVGPRTGPTLGATLMQARGGRRWWRISRCFGSHLHHAGSIFQGYNRDIGRYTSFYQGMVEEVSELLEKKYAKVGKELGSIARPLYRGPPFSTTTKQGPAIQTSQTLFRRPMTQAPLSAQLYTIPSTDASHSRTYTLPLSSTNVVASTKTLSAGRWATTWLRHSRKTPSTTVNSS